MKKSLLILALTFCITLESWGQSFSASPRSFHLQTFADELVVYNNVNLDNLTNASLELSWKMLDTTGLPIGWTYSIQDPDSFYVASALPDSGTFELTSPADFDDKFILQVYPNGVEGDGQMRFILSNTADQSDSTLIVYKITCRGFVTGIQESARAFKAIKIVPNPGNDYIVLSEVFDQLQVLTLEGKEVSIPEIAPLAFGQTQINIANLVRGTYIIKGWKDGEPYQGRLVKY